MKKLTFKISTGSIIPLIQEINRMSYRIYPNLETGHITVEDVNDYHVDSVIDLVDNYCSVLNIVIDNAFEKNDTIIKKIESENKFVEQRIRSFLKTVHWAIFSQHASEKEISDYILTIMYELSTRYSPKPIIPFSVGDIVDVNYGNHLPGEIMGGHVNAIVCNILNKDMAYIVPITTHCTSPSHLFMDVSTDTTHNNELCTSGNVLLDKGKYVRAERFNSIRGRTTPEFFEKLLRQLASTFDFTSCLTESFNDDSDLPFIFGGTTDKVDQTLNA